MKAKEITLEESTEKGTTEKVEMQIEDRKRQSELPFLTSSVMVIKEGEVCLTSAIINRYFHYLSTLLFPIAYICASFSLLCRGRVRGIHSLARADWRDAT